MNCPNCKGPSSAVLSTRRQGAHLRRRRECFDCFHRWSTVEIDVDQFQHLLDIAEKNKTLVELVKAQLD